MTNNTVLNKINLKSIKNIYLLSDVKLYGEKLIKTKSINMLTLCNFEHLNGLNAIANYSKYFSVKNITNITNLMYCGIIEITTILNINQIKYFLFNYKMKEKKEIISENHETNLYVNIFKYIYEDEGITIYTVNTNKNKKKSSTKKSSTKKVLNYIHNFFVKKKKKNNDNDIVYEIMENRHKMEKNSIEIYICKFQGNNKFYLQNMNDEKFYEIRKIKK